MAYEPGVTDAAARDVDDRLREIRSEVVDKSLVVLTVVAIPALVASLSRIIDTGWLPVMAVHIVLALSLFAVAAWRKRLGFVVRAVYLIGFCFMVGLGALFTL